MTLLTVMAEKATTEAYAGVGFSRCDDDSPLIIASLDSFGLFGKSPLIPGLIVQKINGKNMMWEHPRDAAKEIKNSSGTISITAEGSVAKIRKNRKKTTGLVLKDSKTGDIIVTDIREDSVFALSELKVGMKILTINTKPCPKPAWRAIHNLQRSAGRIKIVAAPSYRKGGAPCWRPSMLEPELRAFETSPPESLPPPIVEDHRYDLQSFFERLCGTKQQEKSLLTSAYGPIRGILRKRKVAPALGGAVGEAQSKLVPSIGSKKSVRFNKSRIMTREYDPAERPCTNLPLDAFDAVINDAGSSMDDESAQSSLWSL